MNRIFLVLIIVLNTSQLYATDSDTCIDKDIVNEANYHLSVDPVTTKTVLSDVPDCDEKYALMHKANVEIARKCREDFYYQGNINPHGWYAFQTPNMYEKHVMENPDEFNPGGEAYSISVNDYWIKKIKNPDHPVLTDFAYQKIKKFYNWVWEDGDGSMHNEKLIKEFTEWIIKYPNHANVSEAQGLIERMKNYKGILIPQ